MKHGEKQLRPVPANIGIEEIYKRKLEVLVDEMSRDVVYWIRACHEATIPDIAQDAALVDLLKKVLGRLARRWLKRFDEAAPRLARYFATATRKRTDAALRKILRDGGYSVRWTMTKQMQDVMDATIHAQVGLIKSIPTQYLGQVEQLVMQSVQAGRKLDDLATELHKSFGVTRKRAALIARDQNNKATATMTRVRQLEVGITEAIWRHSHAGKEPRPTHVAAGARKQRYDVRTGWYDPHERKYIFPGELINCRCFSVPVIKGIRP